MTTNCEACAIGRRLGLDEYDKQILEDLQVYGVSPTMLERVAKRLASAS